MGPATCLLRAKGFDSDRLLIRSARSVVIRGAGQTALQAYPPRSGRDGRDCWAGRCSIGSENRSRIGISIGSGERDCRG